MLFVALVVLAIIAVIYFTGVFDQPGQDDGYSVCWDERGQYAC